MLTDISLPQLQLVLQQNEGKLNQGQKAEKKKHDSV